MDIVRSLLIICSLCWSFVCVSATEIILPGGLQVPNMKPVGQGELVFLGFRVYRAQLWAPDGVFRENDPFVLSLSYQRDIRRDQIVEASLKEMRKLGAPVEQNSHWPSALANVFRDVSENDTISGIFRPGIGADFYFNSNHTGSIDPVLAKHLAAIWLDPNTSEPQLRQALLGEAK